MSTRIAMALLVGAGLLVPGLAATVEGSRSLEEMAVESATTPSDHNALAAHYREHASQARAEAARHRSMARAYTRGKQGTRAASQHCKRLTEHYDAMAMEYEELAKLHETEAKKSP